MDVILTRHGATAGNLRGAYIGSTDEDVTREALAKFSPDPTVCRVCVTPLRRTRQSAAALYPNARQIVIADLREMDFGAFEGRNYEDMAADPAYRAWVEADCLPPCPGGECQKEFAARVCGTFEALVDEALAQGRPHLHCVVHGGVIMAVAARYALPRRDYFSWSVKNGEAAHFFVEPSLWREEKILYHRPGAAELCPNL